MTTRARRSFVGAAAGTVLLAVAFAACAQTALTPIPTTSPTPSPSLVPASPSVVAPSLGPPLAYPPQPAGVPFPEQAWPEGDWPAGVDRTAIDAAVDRAFGGGGEKRVRAVVIIHGGRLVYERYSPHPDDGPARVMPSYSIAKSFTSALVGILVRNGRLDVDVPAAVQAWTSDSDRRSAITLDDLLRMSSGLAWKEVIPPQPGNLTDMIAAPDAAAYVAGRPLVGEPGKTFTYSSGNTILIDRILADIVGSGSEFRAFARAELLDRIGISQLLMSFDDAGTWYGAFSADTTARDFARLGLLYLRDGVWDGERILPPGWVTYSATPSSSNPEYGAGWWLDVDRPGVIYAIGILGNVITVDPAHDLTFVHLATDGPTALPVAEAILDAFAAAPST